MNQKPLRSVTTRSGEPINVPQKVYEELTNMSSVPADRIIHITKK